MGNAARHRKGKRGQQKTLTAGRTGAVQTEIGDAVGHQALAGGYALVLQIPGEQHIHLTVVKVRLFHQNRKHQPGQLALGMLPGVGAETVALVVIIKFRP